MKTSILVAAVVACTLALPMASAQDTAAPAKPAMSMDMDAHMSQMQANMKEMQAEMEKIRATTDPKERQKLMQAHMQTMQDSMTMMLSMSKPMMDGGQAGGMAMGGDPAKAGDKGMMSGDMMKHHRMMEDRMRMMEMMMQQMLEHEQMMESMHVK